MRDDKESASFKEDNFISIDSETELFKVFLESLNIGKQEINNLRPSFVESLVPNWGFEAVTFETLGFLLNAEFLLLEHLLSHVLR